MAFGFSGPGKSAFNHDNFLSFGSISRPNRYLSSGLVTRFGLSQGDIDGIVDVGIRPLGDPRLLLFGDYSLSRGDRWDDGPLAGGVAIRPFPGLEAAARWGDQDRLQLTVGVTLQRAAFRADASVRSRRQSRRDAMGRAARAAATRTRPRRATRAPQPLRRRWT